MTKMREMTTKERIAGTAGWGLTDRLDKEARLAERARCRQMLREYVAQGRTAEEVVAYAERLLDADY